MTSARRATQRAFTVVCCEGCAGDSESSVSGALRESIRRCDHGVLVRAGCLLGPLTCATHRRGPGVMVILQPCSVDRRPRGPASWVGPINGQDDVRVVRDWLEQGEWEFQDLPDRLRPRLPTAVASRRN